MKDLLKLHKSHIDLVAIRSELRSLIAANMVVLKGPGFQVETGPKTTVQVVHVVNLL